MERKKKVVAEVAATEEAPKLRWKKTGGGDFRLGHRIIKENETFLATDAEVPKAFRDIIKLVGEATEEVQKAPAKISPVVYTAEPADAPEDAEDGVDYFNVVNAAGKVINERPLPEAKALQLIEDLK